MRFPRQYTQKQFLIPEKRKQLSGTLAFLLLFSCLQLSLHAEEHNENARLVISAGQIGILDDLSSDSFGLEYRFESFNGPYDLHLIPMIGVLTASNGSNYFYGGLSYDFYINTRWVSSDRAVKSIWEMTLSLNQASNWLISFKINTVPAWLYIISLMPVFRKVIQVQKLSLFHLAFLCSDSLPVLTDPENVWKYNCKH